MSQLAALAEMDADIHAAFADVGIAETGSYLAPGAVAGQEVPCRVYVDRDLLVEGELRQFKAGRIEIGYLVADVTPAKKGRVTVDGETYVNDDEVSRDGSISRWAVFRA